MENINIILSLRGKIFTVTKDRLIKVTGTYFYGMLSSGVWQPNSDGVYVIDRPSEGFERILDCLSTGILDCRGLTDYEIDCVYDNLDYFLIPFTRIWDYFNVSKVEDTHLIACVVLYDGRLCCTASNNGICIYNMDTNIIEKSILGHTKYITAIIELKDGRICSSSGDNTIKLWNVESGQCELSIHGHSSYVNCLIQLLDGRLCSGSCDKTIKISNKDTGVCDLTITGSCTFSIAQLKDGRICSTELNGGIKIWNIDTGVCEITLNGHAKGVTAIVVVDKLRLCSCSADKTIKVWNVTSGVCERLLEGHRGYIRDMVLLQDGRLCSVSYDRWVKIWNIDTGVCDHTVQVSTSLFKVIQLHDGRLVVSDGRRSVYVIGG
jgi:WD40 repeat protein